MIVKFPKVLCGEPSLLVIICGDEWSLMTKTVIWIIKIIAAFKVDQMLWLKGLFLSVKFKV